MIPRRLIRSVPEHANEEQERLWRIACDLHPGWEQVTYRDPIDPTGFPITAGAWHLCGSGAQLAGLVRLEALWSPGGIWIDSDVELFRPLDPLLDCRAFAAWEDANTVPDAVLGAEAGHPAIRACIEEALRRISTPSTDWRTGHGAWSTGPGVMTSLLPGRDDVTLLGSESFYPYHYTEKERAGEDWAANPATFGAHRWAGSWL